MERTITLAGDPNIGVFSRVLGTIAIIPPDAPEDYKQALTMALNVELVETTIQGSAIIGSLVTGNSRGIVMSGLATEDEIATLEDVQESTAPQGIDECGGQRDHGKRHLCCSPRGHAFRSCA